MTYARLDISKIDSTPEISEAQYQELLKADDCHEVTEESYNKLIDMIRKATTTGLPIDTLQDLEGYDVIDEATGRRKRRYIRRKGKKAIHKSTFTEGQREKLADKGEALPDGSFPIRNRQDLMNAIKAIGRAKDYDKAKAHIRKRAKALSLESLLPETWS